MRTFVSVFKFSACLGVLIAGVVIVEDMMESPARVREFRRREAACKAHVCPDGRYARIVVPRYESTLCACEVNP